MAFFASSAWMMAAIPATATGFFFLIVNRVSAADALDENHSLKEIQAFIRRADGRAYIPVGMGGVSIFV